MAAATKAQLTERMEVERQKLTRLERLTIEDEAKITMLQRTIDARRPRIAAIKRSISGLQAAIDALDIPE